MKDAKLIEAQKIVQEVADEMAELGASGALDMPGAEPSTDEVGGGADFGGSEDPGAGPEAPEDEALNLLRDIAGGIGRLADELAPIEPVEDAGEEPGEEEEPGDEDPSLPEPTDDSDEREPASGETMPVPSGA
jgi:hypothetical protein